MIIGQVTIMGCARMLCVGHVGVDVVVSVIGDRCRCGGVDVATIIGCTRIPCVGHVGVDVATIIGCARIPCVLVMSC